MKRKSQLIIFGCLISWTVYLLMLASPGAITTNAILSLLISMLFCLAVTLTIVSLVLVSRGLPAGSTKDERPSAIARVLAALLCMAIPITTYAAVKSLGFAPSDSNFGSRFVYENMATGAGFTSIALIIALSTMQKNTYWLTKKAKGDLDERQLQSRQQVFEVSYKAGTLLVIGAAWMFAKTASQIPQVLANNYQSVPGTLYWVPITLILGFFALPLVIATWKK